ncbi:hypothetical protein ACLB1O_02015 [Escherichia coli]
MPSSISPSINYLWAPTASICNAGVTTFNEVYTVSKAMCNAAREVILMADSSKFGRKSPNVVCSLESVDKLITDAGIDPAFRQALEEKGIDVIITGESNE